MDFGSQDMSGALRRVLMRDAASAMPGADPVRWHYGPQFNAIRAADQHRALTKLIEASACEILWLADALDGLADSVFTHDPSLVTDQGAILLSMGKGLRRAEPDLHGEFYARSGIPVIGRIAAPGTVEGGDCVWLDRETLVVGRGIRTNQAGIDQLSAILAPIGVTVLAFDLPLWQGEDACLHLMSVISPLAPDLALVHAPLLPAAFYQLLKRRGVTLIEGDPKEFSESGGLSLNVLPIAPRDVIAVAGFAKTQAAMETAGCRVQSFEADALCIACEGGPTCLTRPILRLAA